MTYNPFSKPLGSRLTADDLQELIGRAAEGYYIEYKSTFRENLKVAHSVASFANTYGGWYIVGAKTDENHFANEICGFSSREFPDPVGKLRDIVKTRIDPIPVFFPSPIPLEGERTALVVYIPGDQRTPFITDDGKIYRRNHDSSDPVRENSRHTLDHLVALGKAEDEQFARFCNKRERNLTAVVGHRLAWVNLFIRPDPIGIFVKDDVSNPDQVDRLLQLSKVPVLLGVGDIRGNLSFNLAQPTNSSVILKQTQYQLPNQPGVTAEFTARGTLRLNIPVPLNRLDIVHSTQINPRATNAVSELLRRGRESLVDVSGLRTLDVGQILVPIMVVLAFYREWIGEADWIPGFRVAFSIRGVSECIPFADVSAWADQVEKWGLPFLEFDIQFPSRWEEHVAFSPESDRNLWWPIYSVFARELGLDEDVAHQALATAAVKAAGMQPPAEL